MFSQTRTALKALGLISSSGKINGLSRYLKSRLAAPTNVISMPLRHRPYSQLVSQTDSLSFQYGLVYLDIPLGISARFSLGSLIRRAKKVLKKYEFKRVDPMLVLEAFFIIIDARRIDCAVALDARRTSRSAVQGLYDLWTSENRCPKSIPVSPASHGHCGALGCPDSRDPSVQPGTHCYSLPTHKRPRPLSVLSVILLLLLLLLLRLLRYLPRYNGPRLTHPGVWGDRRIA